MPPGSQPLRRAVVALILVAAVGAAAVVVTDPPGSTATVSNESFPSGENISEQYNRLEGVVGTMRTTITRGNETNTTVRLIKARPGTGMRYIRVLNGSAGGVDLIVSNGTVTWQYDRSESTVTRLNTSFSSAVSRGAYVERLFARLDRTAVTPRETTSTATPGIAPLPQVPYGGRMVPVGGNGSGQQFGVSYEGRATIAGREAYVLQVSTGNTTGSGNFSQTLWIDTEWYYILGHRIEGTIDGERFVTNATYLNVTFNPGLDASTFRFEPPEGATVERASTPTMESYDSTAALRTDARMTVPRPDLPPDFSFSVGRRLSLNRSRMISIRYVNDTSTVTVTTFNRTLESMFNGSTNRTDGEQVQVGDHEGTYRTFGLSKTVSWSCDGRSYSVRGGGVSRALLLRIAESVECE